MITILKLVKRESSEHPCLSVKDEIPIGAYYFSLDEPRMLDGECLVHQHKYRVMCLYVCNEQGSNGWMPQEFFEVVATYTSEKIH